MHGMTQLPAVIPHDLDLEATALAHAQAQLERSWVARSRHLGAGVEAQWARLPARLRAEVEGRVATALSVGLGLAGALPQAGGRGHRWLVIASGAAGGSVGLLGALVELPVALVLFLQAIRAEATAAGLDPDRAGVRLATIDILASGRAIAAAEALDPAFISGRLALAGPGLAGGLAGGLSGGLSGALSGWIARAVPRLVPVLGQRLAASAVPLLGALGGAVMNAAWLEHYRKLARIRFRLMALAEHHGVEPVLAAYARAQKVPVLE